MTRVPRAGASVERERRDGEEPLPSDVQRQASSLPARRVIDVDLVGDHEGRIEADAELADERRRLSSPRLRPPSLSRKALVPERAMVPSASISSSRLMPMPLSSKVSVLVVRDRSRCVIARLGVVAEQLGLGERLVAQLLAGVGGVGDQLAQKISWSE